MNLPNLHRNIATDVWPNWAILSCTRCRYCERITSAAAGRYLAQGWPTHCGRTMSCEAVPHPHRRSRRAMSETPIDYAALRAQAEQARREDGLLYVSAALLLTLLDDSDRAAAALMLGWQYNDDDGTWRDCTGELMCLEEGLTERIASFRAASKHVLRDSLDAAAARRDPEATP